MSRPLLSEKLTIATTSSRTLLGNLHSDFIPIARIRLGIGFAFLCSKGLQLSGPLYSSVIAYLDSHVALDMRSAKVHVLPTLPPIDWNWRKARSFSPSTNARERCKGNMKILDEAVIS